MSIYVLQPDPSAKDNADTPSLTVTLVSTEEERNHFDVEAETEALYRIHKQALLEHSNTASDSTIASSDNPVKRFTDAALKWWSQTGGWEHVAPSLRDRYPADFVAALNLYADSFPALKAFVKAVKQDDAASSSPKPRRFDVEHATHVLWKIAYRSLHPGNTPAFEIDAHFNKLADMWWEATGGPAQLDSAVLGRYPTWFVGKLLMHRYHTESVHGINKNPAIDPQAFDPAKATRELFDKMNEYQHSYVQLETANPGLAKRVVEICLAEHEKSLGLRVVNWCHMTGGWRKLPTAMRGEYPKWFVDKMTAFNNHLGAAKLMAYEWWFARFANEQDGSK